MKTVNKILATFAGATLLVNSAWATIITTIPAYPGGIHNVAVTKPFNVYATGGDVEVSYLGLAGAHYIDYFFLAAAVLPGASVTTLPITGTSIFQNQTGPTGPVDLGNFAAGSELIFGIRVNNTGKTYYSGAGSRNDDGVIHMYGVNNYLTQGTTYLGFEDLPASIADFNYADMRITVTGVTNVPKSIPDNNTGTFTLLLVAGMVLVPWTLRARRHQRQTAAAIIHHDKPRGPCKFPPRRFP